VDAVITYPPYGSNVQYLELSHFWYPWNQDLYDRYPIFELEAVANRKKGFNGAKSQYDYENNLYEVFRSAYRALKLPIQKQRAHHMAILFIPSRKLKLRL
jgi:hypothetical protein